MNWQTHGGSGPYLLLVHGFLASAAQWQCNLAGLQPYCQPVTVNLLGHGGSESPATDAPYRPEAYLARFEQLRERLGIERWYVLGYSMGAGLTIRYALEYPERTIGQLLTNSTSAFADAARQEQLRTFANEHAEALLDGGLAAVEKLAVHPRHAVHLPVEIKAALLADAEQLNPLGIAQTMRQTIPRISVREQISNNEVPALLLWGDRERRFAALAEHALTTMPKLSAVKLATGHAVNMEQPDLFNHHAIDFMQQCLTS